MIGTDHYIVISSDSHCGADLLDYKPYLEKKWHDEFDAWATSYTNPWEFMDARVSGIADDDTRVNLKRTPPGSRHRLGTAPCPGTTRDGYGTWNPTA